MLQSFYTGNAGLGANKNWLSIISDNIANVNTTGFKQERANFQDLVSSSLTTFSSSGTPKNKEIGAGTFVGSTSKDFSQGAFKNTNDPLNLALDGEGFFMVKNPSANLDYYTRDGNFRVDSNGDIITQNGYKLQGWMLDDQGNMAGAMRNITIPSSVEPHKTSKVKFEEPTNLDSTVPVITAPFNKDDSSTYNYVNAMPVYDSLGNAHTLAFYFVHSDSTSSSNTWKVYAVLDDDANNQQGPKELSFDQNGELTSSDATQTLNFTLQNGAGNLSINVDYAHVKEVASDFIFYSQQDGYAKGDLMSISVSEDGIIKGSYTNGQVKDIARLAIATFKDKETLVRKGDNLYLPNQQTFTPIIVPGGVISKVRSGMLEMSNVDVSQEFINLITAQRAYQASAKTITTSDQVLQTTMDIKR